MCCYSREAFKLGEVRSEILETIWLAGKKKKEKEGKEGMKCLVHAAKYNFKELEFYFILF